MNIFLVTESFRHDYSEFGLAQRSVKDLCCNEEEKVGSLIHPKKEKKIRMVRWFVSALTGISKGSIAS
jgi:hypothetical protein